MGGGNLQLCGLQMGGDAQMSGAAQMDGGNLQWRGNRSAWLWSLVRGARGRRCRMRAQGLGRSALGFLADPLQEAEFQFLHGDVRVDSQRQTRNHSICASANGFLASPIDASHLMTKMNKMNFCGQVLVGDGMLAL